MKNTSSNKSFFNKIWNKFKHHLMINFKTNEENERDEAIKYVNQAFDNQDNLFIMISNGLKPNNTKDNKVKLDENKIAEIIVNTVQPMLDKALEPIKKDISELKWYTYQLVDQAKEHGWTIKDKK